MKTKEKLLSIYCTIFIFFMNISVKVSARAGGHSSHSSGHSSSHSSSRRYSRPRYRHNGYYHNGGSLGSALSALITLIILTVSIIFITYFIYRNKNLKYISLRKKRDKAYEKLAFLKTNDYTWDLEYINERFKESFFAIQDAWKNKDMTSARQYVSNKIYTSYEKKINKMKRKHETNIMEDLNINEFFIVSCHEKNFLNQHKTFKVLVDASLIDYIADDYTNAIKRGVSNRTSFKEVWTFIYLDNKWVLNKIEQVK